MVAVIVIGLLIAIGSIAGIVALARSHTSREGTAAVFSVMGMVLLGFFALGGTAAAGCAAMLKDAHF